MITENLTAQQRLQLLNELMQDPTPEEADMISRFKRRTDEKGSAQAATEIANRRNNQGASNGAHPGEKI